jgi:hypothetical protein
VPLPDDIGVAVDAWDQLSLPAALERAAAYASLVEIYSADGNTLLTTSNRKAALDSGLRLTVHGPFEELDVGSTSE